MTRHPGKQLRHLVRDQVWDQVWYQVQAKAEEPVLSQVHIQSWNRVRNQPRTQAWDQLIEEREHDQQPR